MICTTHWQSAYRPEYFVRELPMSCKFEIVLRTTASSKFSNRDSSHSASSWHWSTYRILFSSDTAAATWHCWASRNTRAAKSASTTSMTRNACWTRPARRVCYLALAQDLRVSYGYAANNVFTARDLHNCRPRLATMHEKFARERALAVASGKNDYGSFSYLLIKY